MPKEYLSALQNLFTVSRLVRDTLIGQAIRSRIVNFALTNSLSAIADIIAESAVHWCVMHALLSVYLAVVVTWVVVVLVRTENMVSDVQRVQVARVPPQQK